ncbi:glycosyltransferase family 2 protein [Acidimangrovimonas sediminis]|uniref:glycosyltransferase family 2 protein n=1 Tax=Acidimangrovimonas sediminis TaxID=2056283 RepID=UPI000C7F88DF|nr:glycosyltransferase family 2 protein [Acidimangrovimonas sediminis]
MTGKRAPEILGRRLGAGSGAGLHWLDAIAHGGRFRAFFATGTPSGAFDTAPRDGCDRIDEIRVLGGAVMVLGTRLAGDATGIRLPLTGGAALEVPVSAVETDLLAGRDCLLAVRIEESPEVLRDWLAYHHAHHGVAGAVIVDRAGPGSAAPRGPALVAALQEACAGLPPALRVVVLTADVPLGKPGIGPETHPFLAPDAPGKDRMEPPPPDRWRAPMGEFLVHEVARSRFLDAAGGVANIDVSDLLAPRPRRAPTVFGQARGEPSGVVVLSGRRIYPWRVREGEAESFGDHICAQFDATGGMLRWCVAPQIAGPGVNWRAIRIGGARPEPSAQYPFLRCMGIRVPGRNASELAPKTSLVEDPALLEMARGMFGAKPVRPPKSEVDKAPALARNAGRTAIVTTMKNEGPFILEWLAYHRAIGVEDFLVYTNDCTDGTDTMLHLLQRKGIVQHRENPFRQMPGLKPQHAALAAAETEAVITGAGWAICMDVDEFIDVKIGDGTLAALYAAMGDANMISLTWRLFGNGDVHAYEDRFVIEQFTRCAPEVVRKPHQAWGFKTLFRNIGLYKKLGVHRPKGLKPDLWPQVRWLNGSGKPMPVEMMRNGWRSTLATYGYDWVSLNHYAVRSAESFLVKRDRGRVNHTDRDQGLNYWFRMNHNAEEETSIQRMIPAARAEFDRLMADPEIAAAHAHSVACHRAKIAELQARPDQAEFYEELTGPRMEKLSRLLHVFGANVFNAGPHVIPEDLHERDLPEDFFFTVQHEGEAQH